MELQVYYNNADEAITNLKSRFVSVEVLKPRDEVEIDLSVGSGKLSEEGLEIINSGSELANVRISIVDAPQGLSFEPVSLAVFKKNEQVYLKVKEKDFSGKANVLALVESKEGTRVVSLAFEVPQEQDFMTGFVSLVAWPLAFIIGIIVLIFAVLGLLSVVSKK